ncbi:MAG: hypothetical protein GF346_05425, partial [Candidatus Eisenbacteria bacterium]|nr:hypothetical protein [Candidatus Latescibacterota bacterium]MBD3301868.1 hypothetical protein [Candidatus Eisenbacteria bacterium]
MTEKPHITPDRILDLLESRDGTSTEVRDHLQRCAACSERFRAFERLLSLLETARIPEPDEALIRRTWERIRTEAGDATARPSPAARLTGRLREVWATLSTESLVPSLAVRGGQLAAPRLLVYETPAYAISLSIAREEKEGGLELRGR